MNILICPDKFKGSLTAEEVALHIKNGISKVLPDSEIICMPMADGGEGTVSALVNATKGKTVNIKVHDPLMRVIDSFYGVSGDRQTAFIEMSAASGMSLLKPGEKNPLKTTSFGTGEIIKDALDKGCRKIIIGLGGSATVDGGMGMAQALGISFKDKHCKEIDPGGRNLGMISEIDMNGLDPRVNKCKILAACDVTNVMFGVEGAAFVYGPQKGADKDEVVILDNNLNHLSNLIAQKLSKDVSQIPGSGAAGGMGAGINAFLNGELRNGFDLIAETINIKELINTADIIITGEGKIDSQTFFGKTPAGVAKLARESGKKVIAFTGLLDFKPESVSSLGFNVIIPICDKPMTSEQSISSAAELLENAAERSFRLISLFRNNNS